MIGYKPKSKPYSGEIDPNKIMKIKYKDIWLDKIEEIMRANDDSS